jgi:hypothetical protein
LSAQAAAASQSQGRTMSAVYTILVLFAVFAILNFLEKGRID